jgi:hypothetical protein
MPDLDLDDRLRRYRHQPRDDHEHAVRDLHQPGLGSLLVLSDNRNEHRRAKQVLAHFGDLAAEIGERTTVFEHIGGIGRIASLHGVLTQRFQLLLAAVERDLARCDPNLQPMQTLADRKGLLIEQLNRNGEIGLGLPRFGLLAIHQIEEGFAIFLEALEGSMGVSRKT